LVISFPLIRTLASKKHTGRRDSVDLKNVLGDIQTDRGNLHSDTSMPGAGVSTASKPAVTATSKVPGENDSVKTELPEGRAEVLQ
jgi:hypothetical protein